MLGEQECVVSSLQLKLTTTKMYHDCERQEVRSCDNFNCMDFCQKSSPHWTLNPGEGGPVVEGGQGFRVVLQPGAVPVQTDETQDEHNRPARNGHSGSHVTCAAFSDSGTSS